VAPAVLSQHVLLLVPLLLRCMLAFAPNNKVLDKCCQLTC
jgi:hypothetical protein